MPQLIQVTAWGEEHGLLKKYANSVQGDGFGHMKPDAKAKAEKKKKHDAELIKARYHNKNGGREGLPMVFNLGAGEPLEMWKFINGNVYDVPRGLVEQVNSKKEIKREGRCDENGENPSPKDEYVEPEHQFFPASF